MHKFTIIIPAYNEEITIEETINDFFKVSPKAFFCIVDNNSSDKTASKATQALKKLKANGQVIFVKQKGKANALKNAFEKIDSEYYLVTDADTTYKASDLKYLIESMKKNNSDMVVGDRLSEGTYKKINKRSFHSFGNNLIKNTINILFKSNLKDITSGYRLMNHKFIKNFPIATSGFEIETEMSIHALLFDYKVSEVPVKYGSRPDGSASKLATFKDGIFVFKTILKTLRYYKPLLFFSIISLLFFIVSLIIAKPVITDWYKYKYIFHIPSAILASALGILSVISIFTGIILDNLSYYELRNHQLRKLK